MRKFLSFFFVFVLCLSVGSVFVGVVEAQTTYEWVEDGSFEGMASGFELLDEPGAELYTVWVKYDFTGIISPSKFVLAVKVKASDFFGSFVYVDAVSLLSTVEKGEVFFDYAWSPELVDGNKAYSGTSYVFTGMLYDGGVLNGTGTFSVTHSLGASSGSIVMGVFSFQVLPRTVMNNLTAETFVISVVSDLYNFTVSVQVYWLNFVPPDDFGNPAFGGGWFGDANFVWLLLAMFVCLLPGLLIASQMEEKNRSIGFFSGMSIGTGIVVMAGFAQFWFVLLMILVDTLLLVSLMRRS